MSLGSTEPFRASKHFEAACFLLFPVKRPVCAVKLLPAGRLELELAFGARLLG